MRFSITAPHRQPGAATEVPGILSPKSPGKGLLWNMYSLFPRQPCTQAVPGPRTNFRPEAEPWGYRCPPTPLHRLLLHPCLGLHPPPAQPFIPQGPRDVGRLLNKVTPEVRQDGQVFVVPFSTHTCYTHINRHTHIQEPATHLGVFMHMDNTESKPTAAHEL